MKTAYDLEYSDLTFTSMKVRNRPHGSHTKHVRYIDDIGKVGKRQRRRADEQANSPDAPENLWRPQSASQEAREAQPEETFSHSRQLRKKRGPSALRPGRDTSVITSAEADLLRDIQPCDSALYTLAEEVHARRVQQMGGQAVMDAEVKKLRATRERVLAECGKCAGPNGPVTFCCSMHLDNMAWIRRRKEACGYKYFSNSIPKRDIVFH